MKVLWCNGIYNLDRAKWIEFDEKDETLYAYESFDGTAVGSRCPILSGDEAVRAWEEYKKRVDLDLDRERDERDAQASKEPDEFDAWLAEAPEGTPPTSGTEG